MPHSMGFIQRYSPLLLIPLTYKKWTPWTGFGGRHEPDSVDGLFRIHWPPCSGIRRPQGRDDNAFI